MSTNFIYSYEWAQNVVERFTERYARGTNFVAKMSNISHKQLCNSLIRSVRCSNQVRWEAMKRVIKSCNRESFSEYRHVPVEERRKYLSIVKWNAQDIVLSEMDLQKGSVQTFLHGVDL